MNRIHRERTPSAIFLPFEKSPLCGFFDERPPDREPFHAIFARGKFLSSIEKTFSKEYPCILFSP